MRSLEHLGDDNFGEVWLARNVGWLDGVGFERGGDDALAALVEADVHDVDERDMEHKAVWIRAKACVGEQLVLEESTQEEGFEILRQCADADDCFAALVLGSVLLSRQDFQRYNGEGMKHLEKAAALGSIEAMNDIGTAYQNGFGVQKDTKKALEWWQRADGRGGCNATASMNYLFQRGCDGYDESKAFHYCALAADYGEPMALNNLGSCYEKGIGVARNLEKAFSLYSMAYSLSLDDRTVTNFAQYPTYPTDRIVTNLARCFTDGIGTKQDVKKGIELYNKAVEMGNTTAMVVLGQLLWSGNVIEKDEQRGLELLKHAAELGDSDANLLLSCIDKDFHTPAQGLQQDTTLPLFQQLFLEGISYLVNEKMKNPELGFDYMQRTVQECEHVIASNQGQNLSASMENHLLNKYALALYFIGYCYETGTGVSKNVKEAVKCYQRGSSLNNPSCIVGLGHCYENMIGVECNTKKAFELFKRASDLGFNNGMFNLGRCYENGIGVKANQTKALELYRRASKLGSPEAKERLESFDKNDLSNKLQTLSLS